MLSKAPAYTVSTVPGTRFNCKPCVYSIRSNICPFFSGSFIIPSCLPPEICPSPLAVAGRSFLSRLLINCGSVVGANFVLDCLILSVLLGACARNLSAGVAGVGAAVSAISSATPKSCSATPKSCSATPKSCSATSKSCSTTPKSCSATSKSGSATTESSSSKGLGSAVVTVLSSSAASSIQRSNCSSSVCGGATDEAVVNSCSFCGGTTPILPRRSSGCVGSSGRPRGGRSANLGSDNVASICSIAELIWSGGTFP